MLLQYIKYLVCVRTWSVVEGQINISGALYILRILSATDIHRGVVNIHPFRSSLYNIRIFPIRLSFCSQNISLAAELLSVPLQIRHTLLIFSVKTVVSDGQNNAYTSGNKAGSCHCSNDESAQISDPFTVLLRLHYSISFLLICNQGIV